MFGTWEGIYQGVLGCVWYLRRVPSHLVLERVYSRLELALVHKVCGDTHTNRHPKGCFHKEGCMLQAPKGMMTVRKMQNG